MLRCKVAVAVTIQAFLGVVLGLGVTRMHAIVVSVLLIL